MKPIVPAKLTRPNSRRVLARKRLFQLIEQGREKKVIWISAPAGSGKTTLAASYFESGKTPCFWYQVDEGDTDLATFFYYLGLLAEHAAPCQRKPLPLLTPEYLQGLPAFSKRFFEQLCSQLIDKTRCRSSSENGRPAIVFDNYQDVPEDSFFQEVINAGLSSIPPGITVIVLSRSQPPPAYARLRAAGEIGHLSWDDIRLTADESNAIALLKAGRHLSGETLAQLYQITRGWAAGLVLLLERMGMEDSFCQLSRDLPREEIFAYFATELFQRSSPEHRAFLLETAFLPSMNARMAEELTGNAGAARILSDLNRRNYFTQRYPSPEQAFQYHLLFREFLLDKAKETMSPEDVRAVKERAARVLDANGCGEDAVNLFRGAREWAEATRVILSHAPDLISQGRWRTVRSWIEALPERVTDNQPWLHYWMGVCRLPTSPDESRKYFAKAFEQFKSGGEVAGSFLALSGMMDSVTFGLDSYQELDRLIPLVDELLEDCDRRFPSPEIEWRVVASMLGALVLRQPDHPAFDYWEHRRAALAGDSVNVDAALRSLLALAFHHICAGRLQEVPLILDAFHEQLEASDYPPLSILYLRDMQAFFHWLSANFRANRRAVENGIMLADAAGVHVFDVFLYGHGAAGSLSVGDVERAERYLKRMHSCLQVAPSAHGEALYHDLMAWSGLLRNHLARAAVHADLAVKFGAAMGSPLMAPYHHLIKAIVMHELKDDTTAALHLREVWNILGTLRLHQAEFMALLSEARIAFDGGDETSGRDFLRRAMVLGREHGYENGFFWVSSTMARLCAKALDAGIETEYVQDLIRKRKLVPDVPVQHLETWPWPLRIRTLGQFELERDGEVVRFSGKVQQKPLLLLKALIAFGGREVKEEQLCDALWPDAEGDLAHRSFETTLYRLRQLLGKDGALRLSEGRLTIDRQTCWVDAFALDQLLGEAEALWENWDRCQGAPPPPRDAAARAVRVTQSALAMYRGHFLGYDAEQLWMLSLRERLRAKFVRGIDSLGSYWKVSGEWETAAKCYEKGLDVDDLAEEFYQNLMICYRKLGLRAKVLAVYRRCRSLLEARLGLEPSAETQSLLDGLRSIQ